MAPAARVPKCPMGLIAITFAPWQAYLVLSRWLYGVYMCSIVYGQVVVCWQCAGSVLQAGGGGPAGYSIGRRWYEYSVFYRLVVVCLCCVLQADSCGPTVCSMGRQ